MTNKHRARTSTAWTHREDSIIREMRAAGSALQQIAARLGRRTPEAVAKRVQRLIAAGVVARRITIDPDRKPWTPTEDGILCQKGTRRVPRARVASALSGAALPVAVLPGVLAANLCLPDGVGAHVVEEIVGSAIAVVVLLRSAVAGGRESGADASPQYAIRARARAALAGPNIGCGATGLRLAVDA